jgi:hypothetical protein
MATKPNFVFVDVPERPKQNSIAVKRQRLIEGLAKQSEPPRIFWRPISPCYATISNFFKFA